MKRPSCTVGIAQRWAMDGERIMEFSHQMNGELAGGLISLREHQGKLRLEVYRVTGPMEVIVPKHTTADNNSAEGDTP